MSEVIKMINGTLFDSVAILVGGVAGLLLRNGSEQRKKFLGHLLQIVVVVALVHGIGGALHGIHVNQPEQDQGADQITQPPTSTTRDQDTDQETANSVLSDKEDSSHTGIHVLVILVSLCVGYYIGDVLKLDRFGRVDLFGAAQSHGKALSAFATATLLSLIGPLSIIGPIENALNYNPRLLIIKAGLDLIATFVLASRMGPGVLGSVFPVFGVQAIVVLFAGVGARMVQHPEHVGDQLASVGGIILVFLALNILGVRKIEALDFEINALKLIPALGIGLIADFAYHPAADALNSFLDLLT